jgi:hypothetical protein
MSFKVVKKKRQRRENSSPVLNVYESHTARPIRRALHHWQHVCSQQKFVKKLKLVLCLIKHQVMKAHGTVDNKLQTFLRIRPNSRAGRGEEYNLNLRSSQNSTSITRVVHEMCIHLSRARLIETALVIKKIKCLGKRALPLPLADLVFYKLPHAVAKQKFVQMLTS